MVSAACLATAECPKKSPDNVSRQYCQAPWRGNSIEIILASLCDLQLLAEEYSHLKYAMQAELPRKAHWLRYIALKLLSSMLQEEIDMYICSALEYGSPCFRLHLFGDAAGCYLEEPQGASSSASGGLTPCSAACPAAMQAAAATTISSICRLCCEWHLCSKETLMRHSDDSCFNMHQVDDGCAALELNKQKLFLARSGSITSHG